MDIKNHIKSKDIKPESNDKWLQVAGTIMSMIGTGYGIYSSIRNQGRDVELMDLQHELNLDTFDKTGYSAQVNQMRNAGLNPALMYGMGSGGNPEIGNSSISNKDEDVKLAKMTLGLHSMDLASQVKLRDSEADLNEAKADEIRGIDKELKETTAKMNESIASLNSATEELNKLKYNLEKAKTEWEVNKMTVQVANIIADTALKNFELNFRKETADDSKNKLKQEVNKLVWEQLRIQSQIIVDKSVISLNYKNIENLNFKMNEIYELEMNKYYLELSKQGFEIDKFNKEFSLNYQKLYMDALINDNKGSILPPWFWRRLETSLLRPDIMLNALKGNAPTFQQFFDFLGDEALINMKKNTSDENTIDIIDFLQYRKKRNNFEIKLGY